jgi:hypothetical protein
VALGKEEVAEEEASHNPEGHNTDRAEDNDPPEGNVLLIAQKF